MIHCPMQRSVGWWNRVKMSEAVWLVALGSWRRVFVCHFRNSSSSFRKVREHQSPSFLHR